jgi:hypothetical protein
MFSSYFFISNGFKWAHFFHGHCGVARSDALSYQSNLLKLRLGPEHLMALLGTRFGPAEASIGDTERIVNKINYGNLI